MALAAADIGSQVPGAIIQPHVDTYWALALRLVTTMPALDNRFTRTDDWALTWTLLQIGAILAGDLGRMTVLNRWHGLVVSSARRTWSGVSSTQQGRSSEQQTSMILTFTLYDTVQSICLNIVPAAYHNFGSIPLASSYKSLQHLLTQSVFGRPDSRWPYTSSPRDSLIMLLIILNEIVVWEKHLAVVVPEIYPADLMRENTPRGPGLQYRAMLGRALSKWDRIYSASTTPEIRALYSFCRLYLDYPAVVYLPGFASLVDSPGQSAPAREKIQQSHHSILDGSRHAWGILERASERTGIAPPWLPMILYQAALVVWHELTSQAANTRNRGSLLVLRLFEEELQKMAWPCCSRFVEHLASLRHA